MASTVKHLRSSTANKRPTASGLADGQLGINTASGTPGVFFKDSAGTVVKVGPAHVGASAPNATPAGSAGNSLGELWVNNSTTINGLNYYTGSAFVNLTPSGTTTVAGLVELATDAETQTGTDTIRAVTPSGLQSKISNSISTTSSTTIASATAVKTAYDLANAALPKTGGRVTGNLEIGPAGSLSFEGSSDDGFETTLAVVNPTADRTVTFPNVTGTVVTTGDSNTVTGTMIAATTITNAEISASAAIALSKLATGALPTGITITSENIVDGTIVNADINASAAIAGTKISPNFGSQDITIGDKIIHDGDTNTAIRFPAADTVTVETNGTEAARIDSFGRLLIGTSSARANFGNSAFSARLQVEGTGFSDTAIASTRNGNDILGPSLVLSKSRGTAVGSNTLISSGDELGSVWFQGSDGTEFVQAARIEAQVDGTPGSNDMPGRLVFSTTADGASSPTERMRIDSQGLVGLGTSSPGATLDVNGTAIIGNAGAYGQLTVDKVAVFNASDAPSSTTLYLTNSSGGTEGNGNYGPSIGFGRINNALRPGGAIATVQTSSDADQCGLAFFTHSSSATNNTLVEALRITSDGDVHIGNSTGVNITSSSSNGSSFYSSGVTYHAAAGVTPLFIGRNTNDGNLVAFYQAGTNEGNISVSGSTVSYNPFLGSHWGRLVDGSKPDILPGTILDTVDQLIEWKQAKFTVDGEEKIAAYNGAAGVGDTVAIDYEGTSYSAIVQDEEEEPGELNKHVCVKVNDTASSKAVFGVFLGWDHDIPDGMVSTWNDLYCAAVGNYFVRIADGETLEIGSLIEADGNGCGIVQDDDIIRSKTVAKITSTIPQKVYDDGSFLVTCVLCCG